MEFRPGINSCWEWELGGKIKPKKGIWVCSEPLQHHGERQIRNRPLRGGKLEQKIKLMKVADQRNPFLEIHPSHNGFNSCFRPGFELSLKAQL